MRVWSDFGAGVKVPFGKKLKDKPHEKISESFDCTIEHESAGAYAGLHSVVGKVYVS